MILTEKKAKEYILGYYPGTRKFTPELATEMITWLTGTGMAWTFEDFKAAVDEYRLRWRQTGYDQYKWAPTVEALGKLHKSETQLAIAQLRQESRSLTYQARDDEGVSWIDIPVKVRQRAARFIRDADMMGLAKLFIWHFDRAIVDVHCDKQQIYVDRLNYWGGRYEYYKRQAAEKVIVVEVKPHCSSTDQALLDRVARAQPVEVKVIGSYVTEVLR